MPFNWTDFIVFAEELKNRSLDEAALRSSISRAYYGAFGRVRIYVESKYRLKESSADGVHQKIIQSLKSSNDKGEYTLGNTLSILRNSRNDADYDSRAKITTSSVDLSIRNSKMVIQQLEQLSDE